MATTDFHHTISQRSTTLYFAAAESMNGYMAMEEADILEVGVEKAEDPVIEDVCANAKLLDDIMLL